MLLVSANRQILNPYSVVRRRIQQLVNISVLQLPQILDNLDAEDPQGRENQTKPDLNREKGVRRMFVVGGRHQIIVANAQRNHV